MRLPQSYLAFLSLLLPMAANAQGVDATSITIGEPAVFSGASAGIGVEQWRGVEARVREINDAGGINGRRLQLSVCDDKYEPETAARCAIDLVTKRQVFVLASTVGTVTIVRMLPLLLKWSKDGVLIFGNLTGAKPQRSMPAAPFVFNIRASYEQETATHVQACVKAGKKRIGTFVQNDAFGKDGEEGVRLATKAAGLTVIANTSYERGAQADADMSQQIKLLHDAGVDCVSTTGAYKAVAAFVRAARSVKWSVPIFAVSFTGADQLLAQLGDDAADVKLVMTQVVPHIADTKVPLVREYRAAIDKYKPTLPSGVGDGSYQSKSSYSFGSLEGYLNTKLLGAVLAKAGADLTRERFKQAAESLTNYDIGLGKDKITFAAVTSAENVRNHQALSTVWLTIARRGSWMQIDDIDSLAKQLVGD